MKVMLIANDNERSMVDGDISLSSPEFCGTSVNQYKNTGYFFKNILMTAIWINTWFITVWIITYVRYRAN